jgi:hypothetical protein
LRPVRRVAELGSLGHPTTTMTRPGKLVLIALGVVMLLVAALCIYIARPINDGRTLAERRQIADACLAMLHSTLTNEIEAIKMDDPRIPEVIRALHPHHIEVSANFAVDIHRTEWPQEYFLTRVNSSTWILCVAGPSIRFGGGGREILRMEHD